MEEQGVSARPMNFCGINILNGKRSLRTRLDLIILAIGLFAMVLLYGSGEAYVKLALDTQRTGLLNLVELRTKHVFAEQKELALGLAQAIHHDRNFRTALRTNDMATVGGMLDERFHQYYVTTGILDLESLHILNPDMEVLITVVRESPTAGNYPDVCPLLIDAASKRTGARRLVPLSFLCRVDNEPVHTLITPIGLRPDGYLVVTTDPVTSLARMEKDLGMPLAIANPEGAVIYRSSELREANTYPSSLIAKHEIKDGMDVPAYTISVYRDLEIFFSQLKHTQKAIMAIATLLLLLAIAYVRKVVNAIVLRPMQSLSQKIRLASFQNEEGDQSEELEEDTTCHEFSELGELYGALHEMATTDSLTGLPNRRHFEIQLHRLVENTRRQRSEHALCFLDLDRFKRVNDTGGHAAGDQLLAAVATLFRSKVRNRDLVARLGGDEFAILLEECSLEKATEIANDVLEAVREFEFQWEDSQFDIGVSIGVVGINKANCNVQSILRNVDSACYSAKSAGKDRIMVFDNESNDTLDLGGRSDCVRALDRAIEEQRLQLWYQPIVPIIPKSDASFHCELLLRMKDEHGELVYPSVFIPAAERHGLMPKLDRWVVKNTFTWLEQHPTIVDHFSQFFINISGQSLNDRDFTEYVKTQLAQCIIQPERICFELTEVSAIANVERAFTFMKDVRSMGCKIALDNFGAGISSFSYLKDVPVDYLKIDGRIVDDMDQDPLSRAVIRSIHDIGSAMGAQTVAEHVENHSTLGQLQSIGIDFAQGYGIMPPRRLSELSHDLSAGDSLEIEPESFPNEPAIKPA